MSTSKKINKLLSQSEGLRLEFKKAKTELPSNLFETICAFLNRSGGDILLGVTDDRIIEGVDPNAAENLCKNIVNLSNNPQLLYPAFLLNAELIKYDNKTLIHIFVPSSSMVHRYKNKIYDRSVDGDFELKTDEQIKQAYSRKSSNYSENQIYPFLKEEHFVEGIVEQTRKMIRGNRPNHPWNILTNLEFYKTTGLYRIDLSSGMEGFTMSALLLFGRDEIIQSAIPHYKTDALLKVHDVDRYDDRENIRCNLIDAYQRLMSFVEKHLPDKFYMQGIQRTSLREKIFREIIANILIHREYNNAYHASLVINNTLWYAKMPANHF